MYKFLIVESKLFRPLKTETNIHSVPKGIYSPGSYVVLSKDCSATLFSAVAAQLHLF